MKKIAVAVVTVGLLGFIYSNCCGNCGGSSDLDDWEEFAEEMEALEEELETMEEETASESGGGGGGACADYAACCEAYMEAMSGVDGIPQSSLDAQKQACDSIKDLEGMPGAADSCQQGLDALKEGAEAMKAMPGFEMPSECE